MAHLHAILATDASLALLIMRGPGNQTCTIGWDRMTDSFSIGQWVRKRIDQRATDLSPDGKHFVYWVNDSSWTRQNHVYRAISRAPWLKAIAFWGAAPRTFGAGSALFFRGRDGTLRLVGKPDQADWDQLGLEVMPERPAEWAAMTADSTFFLRLERDGWRATTPWGRVTPTDVGRDRASHRIVFEKSLHAGWTLRQTHWSGAKPAKNRGLAWETFSLVSPSGEVTERSGWEWADWDVARSRVVFTESCVLLAAHCTMDGLGHAQALFDTRSLKFEARRAPY